MTWLHDDLLLYGVFAVYFRTIALTLPLILGAILLLPFHRLSAKVVLAALLVWHGMAMGFWDMYRYVPTAAWMITAALVLRAAIVAWFLAPGGWFSTPLLRAYLRFDPGAGYLLDLARARRGLPLLRTAGQRLGNLPRTVTFTAGPGRIFLAIARGLDGAIWLLAHAPGYWRRPPGTVQLDLPHVVEVIDTEVASSVASFRRTYLNVSLEEYRSHTVQENLERESEARTCAERLALLLAASAECAFFFRTLLPGSAKTISVAYQQWARAWRFRRRYDGLWFDTASAARPAPASREEAVLERAAEPEAEAAEAGESEELRNSDGTAPAAVDEVVAVATPDGPSGFLEPVSEPLAAAVARGTTPEPAPAEPVARQAGAAPEGAAAPASAPTPADTPTKASGASDEELFTEASRQLQEQQAAVAVSAPSRAPAELEEPRMAARNHTVVAACECLETIARLPRATDFPQAAEKAKALLARKETWSTGFHLLVMYGARMDWVGDEADRPKLATIEFLWNEIATLIAALPAGKSAHTKESLYKARVILADLMLSRREFARIRSLYLSRPDSTAYESEVLGDACAGLAEQVASQTELRDMLRFEAIDSYFRAGFRGVWREPVATRLVGPTRSTQHLADILEPYRVSIPEGMKFESVPVATFCRLRVLQGPDAGRVLDVHDLPATLGRAGADITLSDRGLSARHCQLELIEDRLHVRDLDSRNGTVVNGKNVTLAPLGPGDTLRLHKTELVVEGSGAGPAG